jgi:PleD family two-component response regulator
MEEKITILIVDDEEVMRNLLCDILTDAGYKVEAVSCGGEAIEKVQQDKFSIVVTDLKMPGMNGIEVIKKLKGINSGVCVIIITAYPSIESVIEAMREGAYDYIVKPFNIEELRLVIRRAAERQYLIRAIRTTDLVFRYGGEEFAIIYPETPKQGGIEVAKRMLNLAKENMPLPISIGLSCFPDDAENKDDLIKRADEALYQAKRLGKNRICIFGQG